MTATDFEKFNAALYEQKVRALASDLADAVAAGELTDAQANEWMVSKQEQWRGEGL